MKHADFTLGQEFTCDGATYRVTDIGQRTIVAVKVSTARIYRNGEYITITKDELENEGWLTGPPYALQEHIFDENDIPICEASRNSEE